MTTQPPADSRHPRRRRWFAGITVAGVALAATVLLVVWRHGDESPTATPDGTAAVIARALTNHDRSAYAAVVCAAKRDREGDVARMPDVAGPVSVGRSAFPGHSRSEDLFELPAPNAEATVMVILSEQAGGQWCLSSISECLDGLPGIAQGGNCAFQTLLPPGDGSPSG